MVLYHIGRERADPQAVGECPVLFQGGLRAAVTEGGEKSCLVNVAFPDDGEDLFLVRRRAAAQHRRVAEV